MNHVPFIIELKMLARAESHFTSNFNGAAPEQYTASMPLKEYEQLKRLQKAVEDYEF